MHDHKTETSQSRLSRWSKRKLNAQKDEQKPTQSQAPRMEHTHNEQNKDTYDHELAEQKANREAAEAVDLKTLDKESDFSIFMKKGVPEHLKKQALAILWRTNPVLSHVDGLLDYDDDFASPDLIMKTFKSAYQAGKGYQGLFDQQDDIAHEKNVSLAENSPKADETTPSNIELDDPASPPKGGNEAKNPTHQTKDTENNQQQDKEKEKQPHAETTEDHMVSPMDHEEKLGGDLMPDDTIDNMAPVKISLRKRLEL